jgi:hypothetical protein
VKLRQLPTPTPENCQEVWEKCVAVEAADGTMFYLNDFPCLNKWDDSEDDYPKGRHGYTIWTNHACGKGMDVEHDYAHLLGWTFYEEVKPLVWEGECLTANRRGFMLRDDELLPNGVQNKRFRVVVTEIVEGEDAEA